MNKRICVLFSALLLGTVSYGQTGAQSPSSNDGSAPLKSAKGDIDFSRANPEDITNENFPNLIESFDYPNADIGEIVKAISKLTGKNFILDKGVSGKISIIAPSRITVAEAYKAFLTALAMNGYTIVPSGNFLKVRRIQDATQENIDIYAGAYFPNSDQLITRIIRLRYISAEEIEKTLRGLVNKSGDLKVYGPTNSLIVTDLGSNVERISNILAQLDVPGFEEKLVVIPIRYARAKDISDLIDQIINKGDRSQQNRFNPGIPRFRATQQTTSGGSGAANYSLVLPDNRTNSIIVVGNDAGIERIRDLVRKLDFKLNPEDAGGVYVYPVRHGEAEKIANVLNGIATESARAKSQTTSGTSTNAPPPVPGGSSVSIGGAAASQAVFGGDVKVAFDKENNQLIITASKPDYEVVRAILAKIDIPRDQVFVKAVIMEMNASDTVNWGIDYYKVADGTNGLGRAGFRSGNENVLNPLNDRGMVLGWGNDDIVDLKIGTTTHQVPSLLALINFLKQYAGGNILSTPQITALDNEEAQIVVGENVPISTTSTITSTGQPVPNIERKPLELKLVITPFISPDTDSVRMKIEQQVENLSPRQVQAESLAQNAVSYSTRLIKTNVIVNSNDTAVLGGLMQDQETENVVKVPILGDIPILGWLFKAKNVQKNKSNLLVFITPKIIRNSQDSADLLNTKLNERIDFIQQNLKGRDPHGLEIDRLPRKQLSESETEEYLQGPESPDTAPLRYEDDNGGDEEPGDMPGDVPLETEPPPRQG